MSRRALQIPIVLALLTLSALAGAQDDPRKAQAEAVFMEGVKLHDAGKDVEALTKYQKAYDIFPTANILFGIARLEQVLGRSLDAIRHLREAMRSPLLHPANRDLGKKYLVELEGKLGRVDIKGPKGLSCTVAGREYILPLAEPIDVVPDTIEVVGKLGDVRYDGRATAPLGRVTDIAMKAAGAPTSPPAVPAPHPEVQVEPPAEPGASFWTTRRAVGASLGGLAVVAAGVATGFLVARGGHLSDGKDVVAATPQPCVRPSDASCSAYDDARSGFQSAGTGAAISFIASGVLLGAGAAFFFWPDAKRQTSVRLVPADRGVSLVGTF